MKLFVRLAAVYFIIIGLASLLAPQAASGQLGSSLSTFDVFVARNLGVAIVAIGMMNWSISSMLRSSISGLLGANIVANVGLAAIDVLAVRQRVIDSGAWFGIAMHCLLCAGFVYCLVRNYNVKGAKE